MKYKGFEITKYRESYIVARDNEQMFPNDAFTPKSLQDCKKAINAYINGDASQYGCYKIKS